VRQRVEKKSQQKIGKKKKQKCFIDRLNEKSFFKIEFMYVYFMKEPRSLLSQQFQVLV